MAKILSILLFILLYTNYLSAQWTSTSGPEGGVVFAIEKVGNDLWAGTEGGLYISTDNGLSWTRHPAVRPEDNVRTIQVFPGEIVLGVTHFVYDGTSGDPHMFCYRSTDGGATFAHSELSLFNWDGIIDQFYRNGNTLFCKADDEWAKSTDDGQSWTNLLLPNNIYPSASAMDGSRLVVADYYSVWRSADGGDHWIFLDSISNLQGLYLEGDLVIGTTNYSKSYRSTDFGSSWQADTLNFGFDASNLRRGNQGELWQPGNAIIHSFDDGLTWSALTFGNGGYYALTDALQEGNEYVSATRSGVYRTVDGNWTAQNHNLKISRIYALQSNEQGRLIASTNVGAFRTDDEGVSWQEMPSYAAGAGPGGTYTDIVLRGDSLLVISGDRVWRSTDAGQSWDISNSHYWSFADYFAEQNGVVYVPANDSIYYTGDFGGSWQSFKIPGNQYGWYDDIVVVNNRTFVITNDGDILRSTDQFATWTNVHTLFSPGAYTNNRLQYINNRIYAFGRVQSFYSADGGDTWQQVILQGLPVDQSGWAFQPSHLVAADNLLFATVPYNGVYKSSDAGVHWQSLNTGLENLRGRSLAFHTNRLYLGTSTGGVYRYDTQFQSVSGTVYNDLNDNGTQDAGEPALPNILVAAEPLHSYTTSGNSGSYGLLAASFSDTLRAVANTPYATIHPPYYAVHQSGTDFNFGIHYIPGIQDVSVSATSSIPIRPGFASKITVTVKNIGTAAVGASTVKLLLPAGLSYDQSFPAPLQSGDTLSWPVGALQSFESVNLDVHIQCALSLSIGQLVEISTFLDPPVGDADPANDHYSYFEPVVGSYDPNDKRVRPENGITPAQIAQGDRLEYTIRFENTGNYMADYVRILDTLSARVDVASLEIIAASHPVTWSVQGSGIVEFTFPNIFLPPSSTGNGEGYGFVKYSVRCRPGTPLNTNIRNRAFIFFDFNTPVQTNTTSTIVKTSVGTTAPQAGPDFAVAPNPASDYLILTWPKSPGTGMLRLYAADGALVFTQKISSADRRIRVELPALPVGNYQLVWQGQQQAAVGRSITIGH